MSKPISDTTISAAAMVKWLRNAHSPQWTAAKMEKAAAIIERLIAVEAAARAVVKNAPRNGSRVIIETDLLKLEEALKP
jgi:hypothetical protein